MSVYNHSIIEKKWQHFWESRKSFKAEINHEQEKLYVLDMFPYPSASGLHVGHPEGYTATDIYSRYKRMRGYNVLHAMGWDAFGLPAEQHALRTGTHPAVTTRENVDNFRRQIKSLGFSYDWDREINTTDPEYYKWTQSIFLKLFHKGLAYQEEALINWCPELKAVLANEEVKDGLSEIGGHPVYRKPLRQWVLAITHYADRLLDDLETLDWANSIKEMQRNWIGKSTGANAIFRVKNAKGSFTVYTTRPDTLFGATFCVLAPEHDLVDEITTPDRKAEVSAFREACQKKSDQERTDASKEKHGVFTGARAVNPVNGEEVPVWISDYVLKSYGTGAIMSVPAHDQRDHDFASKYGLPIVQVVECEGDPRERAFPAQGRCVNSGFLNGLETEAAKEKAIAFLEEKELGERATGYRLRDWIFSRQRYWGEPIPVLLDEAMKAYPLSEDELPLLLPETNEFQPDDSCESPLNKVQDWLRVELPDGRVLKRETNTMPQWAGSCWYYLRFMDPHNSEEAWSKESENYWGSVDLYVGGAEHAVLHLLYARFWHKVLYDLGLVSHPEPFKKLVNQGMILGPDNQKMSKSRGNVINPDDVLRDYGADSLRLYEMFMGPLEKSKPWQTNGIEGVHRFLKKVWAFYTDANGKASERISGETPSEEEAKATHRTAKKVGEDIEDLKFNTAISQLMICFNTFSAQTTICRDSAEKFVLCLAPFAPHMAEELWQIIGASTSLAYEPWPEHDEALCVDDQITLPVQVNGKLRAQLTAPKGCSKEEIMARAESDQKLQAHLQGKTVRKIIHVQDKILNIVAS